MKKKLKYTTEEHYKITGKINELCDAVNKLEDKLKLQQDMIKQQGIAIANLAEELEKPEQDRLDNNLTIKKQDKRAEIEELAEQLHKWYLEAVNEIGVNGFNQEAQKEYEDLPYKQQYVDRYIADKIISLFNN